MILKIYSKKTPQLIRSKSMFVKTGNKTTDKFLSHKYQQVTEINPNIKINVSIISCQIMH